MHDKSSSLKEQIMTIKTRIIWLLFSFNFVSAGYGALSYKRDMSPYLAFYNKVLGQDQMETIPNKGSM